MCRSTGECSRRGVVRRLCHMGGPPVWKYARVTALVRIAGVATTSPPGPTTSPRSAERPAREDRPRPGAAATSQRLDRTRSPRSTVGRVRRTRCRRRARHTLNRRDPAAGRQAKSDAASSRIRGELRKRLERSGRDSSGSPSMGRHGLRPPGRFRRLTRERADTDNPNHEQRTSTTRWSSRRPPAYRKGRSRTRTRGAGRADLARSGARLAASSRQIDGLIDSFARRLATKKSPGTHASLRKVRESAVISLELLGDIRDRGREW